MKLTERDLDDRIRERAAVLAIADQVERARVCSRLGYAGHPIGHGPLADHAAEPVEFARLIAHLEQERFVTDWPDTIPSDLADLQPHQCSDDIGCIRGLVWAIGITAAAVVVGLTLSAVL